MKAIEQLDRLKRMNDLIKAEKTGTPGEFSQDLGISDSQLYNLIEDLKIKGAPIKYSRSRRTYFYSEEFEFKLNYSLSFINGGELKLIFGGWIKNLLYSNFYRV